MVQNPFNGIERRHEASLDLLQQAMNPFNGIESPLSHLCYSSGELIESIQWNWKISYLSATSSALNPESIQWNWKVDGVLRIIKNRERVESIQWNWKTGGGQCFQTRLKPPESIQWNWKKNLLILDCMKLSKALNPFNGIERIDDVLRHAPGYGEYESIQWNWKF